MTKKYVQLYAKWLKLDETNGWLTKINQFNQLKSRLKKKINRFNPKQRNEWFFEVNQVNQLI